MDASSHAGCAALHRSIIIAQSAGRYSNLLHEYSSLAGMESERMSLIFADAQLCRRYTGANDAKIRRYFINTYGIMVIFHIMSDG
jgi:hypothetical protein